ncbi:MAG: hypothetical protein V4633_17170 [Pseudomonadota bacterium]
MRSMKALTLATLLAAGSLAHAAAPAARPSAAAPSIKHLKATMDLLAAMQIEKMLNSVAGASGYSTPAQRNAVYAKIAKIPPAQIHARLSTPIAKLVSIETAQEMTKFYTTPYGKKVIHSTYNSGPSIGGGQAPAASPAELKDMKRPELVKAQKDLAAVDDMIRHEVFLLLQAISKAK